MKLFHSNSSFFMAAPRIQQRIRLSTILNNCNLSEFHQLMNEGFDFGVYHILTPFFLIMGISTNFIFLAAFYEQSKSERAYGYQVIFTISRILETITFSFYLLADKWFYFHQLQWFVSNYVLVRIFGIDLGVHVVFIINSVLLSVAMAADRTFALVKPIRYRYIHWVKHQIIATVSCLGLALLGAGMYFVYIRVHTIQEGAFYEVYLDRTLEHTVIGQVFFHLRIFLRLSGILVLIILNVVMIRAFRKRTKRVLSMTNKNQDREQERKASERALLWINIYQGCFLLVSQTPHVAWQALIFYSSETFPLCKGRVIGSICDGTMMLADSLDFFFVMAINERMRRLVMVTVNRWTGWCRGRCVRLRNQLSMEER